MSIEELLDIVLSLWEAVIIAIAIALLVTAGWICFA